MPSTVESGLKLKVTEARSEDVGRGFARIDPADRDRLGIATGEIVEIVGKRRTVAKLMLTYPDQRGHSRVQIDGVARENAGAGIDQPVEVRKTTAQPAQYVVVRASLQLRPADLERIASKLDGLPVVVGDRIRFGALLKGSADFLVLATTPPGPVIIDAHTELQIERTAEKQAAAKDVGRSLSYEDIGGLKRELSRIREMIELPLRYPEVFEKLGIDAPKGVLLYGPPGCGKTLIARAVAHETEAKFYSINGPEIIHKFVGESEKHLREIFDKATKTAPSIIFLDEIDAIAPRRENVTGEVEKRVVAQLLALMDGLAQRGRIIVIAATNLPNSLDPALRRPGRFDREISISIPDRDGRREILAVHSRNMPLAEDVSLDHLASITHGFVGADLEALCREAAMVRLRHLLPEIDFDSQRLPYDALDRLRVEKVDFQEALREVEPSAIREVFVEVPEVRWEDVGGLASVKRQLIETVEWPLQYPELFAQAKVKPTRGILLAGPPGCGKTLLAKAVATQSEVNFISVKGPSLLSKYVGDSEKAVREVFRKARQAAPCILFFDELDTLVPERGTGGNDAGVTERVIGQFLAEMDGVEELNGVLILGATNRADILDPALLRPGRFDVIVDIPPPDADSRLEIFRIGMRDKPVANDVDLEALVKLSNDLSGAEVMAVCQKAALEAIREAIAISSAPTKSATASITIRQQHLQSALRTVRSQMRT
jgi:transitional endoplasmic reticulum ATPase